MRGFFMSEYENLLRQIKSQVPVDESFDLLERKLKIGERDATMFFVDGLVDGDVMQRVVASLQGLDKKNSGSSENCRRIYGV